MLRRNSAEFRPRNSAEALRAWCRWVRVAGGVWGGGILIEKRGDICLRRVEGDSGGISRGVEGGRFRGFGFRRRGPDDGDLARG